MALTSSSHCEGMPGVYSTSWCLCYKTNEKGRRGHDCQINTGGTWGKGPPVFNDTKLSGASRDSFAAGNGADAEYGGSEGAEAAYSVTRSRGAALTWSGARTLPQALPEASSGVSPSHASL